MQYYKIQKISKDLQEEYKELSNFQALQLASQIQLTQVLADGLQVGESGHPTFLEAIAMVLGYKEHQKQTILSTLQASNARE